MKRIVVPLGHRGWGTEECYEDDRQALVVYAVYKSKMTYQFDAGTECEVGPIGLNATRVKSAGIRLILKQ